jgi:hypothetical protein
MANVIWCDQDDPKTNIVGQVGHPFSDQDADMQRLTWTRKVPNERYGTMDNVDEVKTFCGYHWRKQSPFQAETAKQIVSEKV